MEGVTLTSSPYGVLAGRPIDRRLAYPRPRQNHYQIRVVADADYRVAVNTQSQHGSEVRYRIDEDFDGPIVAELAALPPGFHRVNGALRLDYARLIDAAALRELPLSAPGNDNDFCEALDAHLTRAMRVPGWRLFAFGTFFRRPSDDPHFHFIPEQVVCNVHRNEGHDGALFLHDPRAGRWVAVFVAFGDQRW